MRLLASTFTSSSNQALGPLQEIADKFEVIQRAGENATSKVGGKLLGLGAAGLGAGAFLSTLASREQAGLQQLRASIQQTGHVYDDYAEQIEKAAKSGEQFGNQASTTFDALNRLTLTTHDPTEALKALSVAQDVAAAKHVPLQKAAEIVGLAFNGSARSGKQFGLQLEQVGDSAKKLAAAQAASVSANDRVTAAQQSYNDKLAVYNQTVKPTLAQQLGLFRAHQNVAKAQGDAAAATARLKAAQDKANASTGAGARNVQKLADVTSGQAAAAADTFAGHLRALGARIEDTAGKFGEKYGSAINTISLGTIAVGSLIEVGLIPKLGGLIGRLGLTGTAFKTLRDVEVATSAEGAAAVEGAAAKEVIALESVGGAGAVAAGAAAGITSIGTALAGLLLPLAQLAGPLAAVYGALERISALAKGIAGDIGPLLHLSTFGLGGKPDAGKGKSTQDLINGLTPEQRKQFFQWYPQLAPDPPATFVPGNKPRFDESTGRVIEPPGAKAKPTAAGSKVPTADDQFKAWLKAMGLGDPANSISQAAAAEAAKVAKQAAVDAATAIRDAIKTQAETAKQLLHDVMQQATELRKSIRDSLVGAAQITDVFGSGPNLNANHAFGSGQDFNAVKRFFEDRLTKLRRFAAEISALVHKGLDPTLVAQIAQAGLDQGGRLADALSGASSTQLGEINNLNKQVSTIADSAGKRIADVQFKAQIAADKKNADMLGKKLDEANKHLKVISREKPSAASDPRAAAFLAGA